MSNQEGSNPEGAASAGSAPKSKLDSLSREDLIRFVKKQVENNKEVKKNADQVQNELKIKAEELTSVQSQLEVCTNEKASLSRRIEELTGKLEFLNMSVAESNNECTANELILKNKITEFEAEFQKTKDEKGNLEQQNNKMLTELEAANTLILELRSQVDDSQAEAVALRERRTVADVFSLEIKDYEKKVNNLQKELKEAVASSASIREELANLKSQHTSTKSSQEILIKEKDDTLKELDRLNKALLEEGVRSNEIQEELAQVKSKLNSIEDDRGSERIELSREVAEAQRKINELEDTVTILRDETKRLRTDRDAAETRAEDLAKDYESFKSRARFVLEQKSKQDAQESHTEEIEKLEKTLAELQETIATLKENRSGLQNDLSRAREQVVHLETENRKYRRESDEAQLLLATTMDELRASKTDFEKNVIEKTQLSAHLHSLTCQIDTLKTHNDKVEHLLSAEREKNNLKIDQLEKQIGEERKLREEAVKQLDDSRKERPSRPAPVAAVYPQFSDREYTPDYRCHSTVSGKLSNATFGEETQVHEPSLEDVLFGECSIQESDGQTCDETEHCPMTYEQLMEELENLRKHAQHTRELLSESETANGRLIEQSRFLKEEIRRLERNDERKEHLENMEYLKNVIIKFLTPERVASEKCQLIPILNTMLRLSHDEVEVLKRAADNDSQTAPGTSWGSYMKWGGFS
ncbi:unnamed protein product [Auanema sp. JU1783]|nr:unnamed protein product [Auanema sp. JU1783]